MIRLKKGQQLVQFDTFSYASNDCFLNFFIFCFKVVIQWVGRFFLSLGAITPVRFNEWVNEKEPQHHQKSKGTDNK